MKQRYYVVQLLQNDQYVRAIDLNDDGSMTVNSSWIAIHSKLHNSPTQCHDFQEKLDRLGQKHRIKVLEIDEYLYL